MKLLIASDIHGCSSSAAKLAQYFDEMKFDRILLLGDILYHGPRNKLPGTYDCQEVARILNGLKDKIICVKGNCDSEVDQMVLEFPITAEYQQLPIGQYLFFATHGHHIGPDNPPPIGSCDVLLCGHTHIPGYKKIGDLLYCNPGSTSIPKGGSKESFMSFDGTTFRWHYIDSGEEYLSYKL